MLKEKDSYVDNIDVKYTSDELELVSEKEIKKFKKELIEKFIVRVILSDSVDSMIEHSSKEDDNNVLVLEQNCDLAVSIRMNGKLEYQKIINSYGDEDKLCKDIYKFLDISSQIPNFEFDFGDSIDYVRAKVEYYRKNGKEPSVTELNGLYCLKGSK